MHSTKYIAILALLGVGSVLSRQNRRSLAQLKALSTQEKCATGAPSYRAPSTTSYAPSRFDEEATPSYVSAWSAFYEAPTVPIYYYNEATESYVPERSPSPQETYFYYNEETESYQSYQPSPAVWTEYYEEPSVSLFYREPSTQTYHEIEEPSPFISYYYWEPSTQSYNSYEPTSVQWTEFFETP
jgi:hypothetical protein